MTNSVRGEVGFKAQGQDWVLLLDFNALCALEPDFPGLMDSNSADLKSPGSTRLIFTQALKAHHPDITPDAAGMLIQELTYPAAAQLLRDSFRSVFRTDEVIAEADRLEALVLEEAAKLQAADITMTGDQARQEAALIVLKAEAAKEGAAGPQKGASPGPGKRLSARGPKPA